MNFNEAWRKAQNSLKNDRYKLSRSSHGANDKYTNPYYFKQIKSIV